MEGRKIIKWGLSIIGITSIVAYSFFVIDDFIRGPRIVLNNPQSGFSTTTPVISIQGRGIHTNNLTINGTQTAVDLNGNFSTQLILAPGYNIIEIVAKDNYGRTTEKTVETILRLKEDSQHTATTTSATSTTVQI